MSRILAVVDGENGLYQVQVSKGALPGPTNFAVALVVQLEAALKMPGFEAQQQAILDVIKAFDVGRVKAEIVYRAATS